MKKLLSILFFLIPLFAFSQTRKEWLATADEAFKIEDYSTAAYYYLKVLEGPADGESISFPYEINQILLPDKKSSEISSADTSTGFKPTITRKETETSPANQRIVHNLAESFRQIHDYINAEKWFGKSAMDEPKAYPDERYWYAITLMQNAKYNKAADEFEKYLLSNTNKNSVLYKSAQKKSLSCDFFAGTSMSINSKTTIEELDSTINGGSASFGPAFFINKDTLAFASARKQSTTLENQNPVFLCDVFSTIKTENGWEKLKNLGSPINTHEHEASGVFSEDGRNFFFTRWTAVPGEKNEYSIYLSRYMNGQWLQPMKLNSNVNMNGYKSMHPAINIDGSILYFSSDRPGGSGKMDLWSAPIDEFGKAGKAVNLGSIINTEENEVSPFYDYGTKILYFSSDGHQGLGGLDVFKSALGEVSDTTWANPLNLKAPINSSRDDAYFIAYKDQSIGYFASDRKLCEKCEGGSCYKIYSVQPVPFIIRLKGTVYQKKTKQPLSNSLITLADESENTEPTYVITDDNGNYFTFLQEEMDFKMKAQKLKFFSAQANISSKGISKSTEIIQDFYLEKIPSGDIVIPGIEYDFDKATLRPFSKLILDTLSDMLKLNDNLVVELSSHTDSRGNDDYNFRLSDERAKSCVQYLITKGIAKDRLQPKGYGETKLIVTDEEINTMSSEEEKEAGHQKNRRTAFRILEEKAIRLE